MEICAGWFEVYFVVGNIKAHLVVNEAFHLILLAGATTEHRLGSRDSLCARLLTWMVSRAVAGRCQNGKIPQLNKRM